MVTQNPFQVTAPTPGRNGFGASNPWLGAMFGAVGQQVSDTMNRQVLPNIARGSVMAGGYGGSRQGIAQGLALGDANRGMIDSMARTGFQAYEGDQYRAVQNNGIEAQRYATATSGQAASDRLALDEYNANQNWARTAQQDQLAYLDKLLGWNQQYGIGNAGAVQNTPIGYWQQFNQGATGLGGMGAQTQTPMYGNPLLGAVGGWQLGQSIFGG